MRLKDHEITAIKETVKKYDGSAEVFLYGSRADDTKKGGDIDILIISDKIKLDEKIKIKIELYGKIGEQKIDLVAAPEINTAFLNYIYKTSIRL
ncbi:MAG: nucleotidyltransferase domain-containing protein [Ignavibacteriaceae bacterium]